MGEWLAALETLMIHCKQACWWMVQFLASEEGRSYIKYVTGKNRKYIKLALWLVKQIHGQNFHRKHC